MKVQMELVVYHTMLVKWPVCRNVVVPSVVLPSAAQCILLAIATASDNARYEHKIGAHNFYRNNLLGVTISVTPHHFAALLWENGIGKRKAEMYDYVTGYDGSIVGK
jgi:hypothetical protein